MPIASVNPATGQTVRTFEELSDAELETRLARADDAFRRWRRTPVAERAAMIARLGALLEAEQEQLGRVMTLEMGKPLRAAIEEAAKCAAGCRYYAQHAEAFLAAERVPDGAGDGYVLHQPLGVVLAVMPWNFPFWQTVRFLAPALAAGNVGLLKHASNVPQCALLIEDLVRRAGAPDGVFQTLLIGSKRVRTVLEDDRVAAATLTGSEGAGSDVASVAGARIKKTVLELGGSDPFIVLPSADVAKAAEWAVKARTVNNGQSCIAAKRFIVHERVADDFERRFADGLRRLKVGDPMAADTDVGPLATPQLVDDLERQLRDSIAMGARLVVGGRRLPGAGNFFEPTLLADVPRDSPAARDETFGPLAALIRVPDADTALAVANDSTFGLGASIWTTDDAEARRFCEELEAGQVFVNAMVASDPRFPFGGVKRSGYGRELGPWGLREFVNVKAVRGRTLTVDVE
jgi:succinate-semialdehyde dehydrogenase/glutarate-semialdehyde dehydrogenase